MMIVVIYPQSLFCALEDTDVNSLPIFSPKYDYYDIVSFQFSRNVALLVRFLNTHPAFELRRLGPEYTLSDLQIGTLPPSKIWIYIKLSDHIDGVTKYAWTWGSYLKSLRVKLPHKYSESNCFHQN